MLAAAINFDCDTHYDGKANCHVTMADVHHYGLQDPTKVGGTHTNYPRRVLRKSKIRILNHRVGMAIPTLWIPTWR